MDTTAIFERVVEDSLSCSFHCLDIVPFWLLLFIFIFINIFFLADETTIMMSRELNTQESGFAYFIEEIFSHLNVAALVKGVAGN